ncbi:MAG: hypothetical protein IJO75_01595 [Clostridia bacterium]|nr:hypothetical protein [Clostridia bacterium]
MQEILSAWSGRLRAFSTSGKARTALIVCGILGVALLVIPELIPEKVEKTEVLTADDFICRTEKRLAALIGSIDGAGACQVMVTLENGVEYVYATEQRSNSDREEDTSDGDTRLTQRDDSESAAILIETDNGNKGLLVTEIQPTVRGVVVVCEGGDNEEVRARVSQAVTVALNISSKRVCVTKLS